MAASNTSSTIRYGCLEQTTSSVFPQLYLPALIKLDQNRRLEVENNIRAGTRAPAQPAASDRRLRVLAGHVEHRSASVDWRNNWGTTYAGHFLLEAEKAGYTLPGDMKSSWLRYQKERRAALESRDATSRALQRQTSRDAARYAQAYRLYTLALAGQPEIGAMNRLRENASLSLAERWLLASTYKLAGKPDVAKALVENDTLEAFVFADANPYTFGSLLRDRAVVLHGHDAARPRRRNRRAARGCRRSNSTMAAGTARSRWPSRWWRWRRTRARSRSRASASTTRRATRRSRRCKGDAPVANIKLPPPPASGAAAHDHQHLGSQAVRHGRRCGRRRRVARKTRPPMGSHSPSTYSDADGKPVDVRKLAQGSDLIAQLTVKNVEQAAARQPGADAAGARRLGNPQRSTRRTSTPRANARRTPDRSRQFWWVPAGLAQPGDAQRRVRRTSVTTACSATSACGAGESIFFETRLNAAYLGRFYLPGTVVEAMYDATQHARLKGQWVEVVSSQR